MPASSSVARRPWIIAVCIVGVVVIAVAAWFSSTAIRTAFLVTSGKIKPGEDLRTRKFQASISARFASVPAAEADATRIEPRAASPSLGSPSATVRIVEFVDYRCPFSRKVAPILRDYLARHASEVSLVIRDFPITELHPDALDAAVAANCVFRQDAAAYWLYSDRLYVSQGAQTPEELRTYALQLGADAAAYDACISRKDPLADIQRSLEDGVAAGVQGTPTFFFNGVKIQGAPDADIFALIVDGARKAAEK